MTICACGCNEEIEPRPWHHRLPPKYKKDHFVRAGLGRRGWRKRDNTATPGMTCGCGCGAPIPTHWPSGAPRYIRTRDGKPYLVGHHLRGKHSPNWQGGRVLDTHGYVLMHVPGHRLADKRGYAREHRIIWEQTNNRPLRPDEDVHHINGSKTDNRPENLVALTKSVHSRVEGHNPNARATREQLSEAGQKGAIALNLKRWNTTTEEAYETLTCEQCGATFQAWKKRERRFCGRKCSGLARRKTQ